MPTTEPSSHGVRRVKKTASAKGSRPGKVPERTMSREELSRHQREVRATRFILAAGGILVILVVAVLGYGWYREYAVKGTETVATVNGHAISLQDYAQRVDLGRKQVEQQLAAMQAQLQTLSSSASGSGSGAGSSSTSGSPSGSGSGSSADSTNASLASLFQQQIQQLQFSEALLPEQTLDQMINEELVRQEAAKRGITASQDEIDQEIKKVFGDRPTPVPQPSATGVPAPAGQPTSTPVPTLTPSPTPTEGPSPTPVPTADVQANVNRAMANFGLSNDQFRSIFEFQVLYDKLQTAMGADVPATEEEIHARHILVDTEDKAKDIVAKLKAGASFEDLAKSESTDTSTKDKGGDLGWFGRGQMVPEFDDAAFKLDVGQISDPVKTTYGYHVIQVLEKDPNHPLSEQELKAKRDAAITNWLDQAAIAPGVTRSLTDAQKNWVYRQIKWSPPALPAVPKTP